MAKSTIIVVTATILLIFFTNKITSDLKDSLDDTNQGYYCSYVANASISFQNNLNILFSDFISQSSIRGYYNTSIGNSPNNTVYGYYFCRGDISHKACHGCILNATQFAQNPDCLHQDAIFYAPKCTFRYANHSMYRVLDRGFASGSLPFGDKVSNPKQFNQTLSTTIESLINETDSESGFATKQANVIGDGKIYSLAQCTPDIVGPNCTRCLRIAMSSLVGSSYGYQGGISNYPNCEIIYSTESFYNNGHVLRPPRLLVIYSSLFFLVYYFYMLFD